MKMFAPHVADGYKFGHRGMFPMHCDLIYSNLTPRSDRHFRSSSACSQHYDGKVVNLGIQGAIVELTELWQTSFFDKPETEVIARFKARVDTYLGPDVVPVDGMRALHQLGYLPINVLALPEGMRVPMGVPLYVIYNTQPEFFWLVNFLETAMSALTWKTVTNATIAFEYRRVFEHFAEVTGCDPAGIIFQGHDFSWRGMSGIEDGARSNIGHLLSFAGTDTVGAIDYIDDYYDAQSLAPGSLIGASVPATEHSVATSNILARLREPLPFGLVVPKARLAAEQAFIRELITEKHPTGIVSIVCDSFDFWGVLTNVLPELKDDILARKPNDIGMAKVVVRPDSGDPVRIIAGYRLLPERFNTQEEFDAYIYEHGLIAINHYEVVAVGEAYYEYDYFNGKIGDQPLTEHEVKGAVEVLYDTFGGTTTSKGYQVLNDRIGLIYGDSITVHRQEEILTRLAEKQFASCNVVLGVGSYTYQHVTRDTFGMAVKATACGQNGEVFDLYKDPATGDRTKRSAKGFLKVNRLGNDFVLEQEVSISDVKYLPLESGELKLIYTNGLLTNPVDFSTLRARLECDLY